MHKIGKEKRSLQPAEPAAFGQAPLQNKGVCTVIFNPVASGYREEMLVEAIRMIQRYGYTVQRKPSRYAGAVVDLVREANETSDLILTFGGDGTAGEAFQALAGVTQKALYSHLPTGTTNDVVQNFRLEKGRPLASLKRILDGEPCNIDVLSVNGNACAYISSWGFVTGVPYATTLEKKRKLGHAAYVSGAVKEILRGPRPVDVTYTQNGKTHTHRCILALVSNSYQFAGVKIYKPGELDLNDGKFEVIFLKQIKAAMIARIFVDYLRNRIDLQKYGDCLEHFSTDQLQVTFDNSILQTHLDNDGEKVDLPQDGPVTLHYTISKSIQMLLPRGK